MTQTSYETVYVRRKVVQHELIDGKCRSAFPEYKIWTGMIARCGNPNVKAYNRYGGRGIVVCDAWKEDFANFYRDMGSRPTTRHSIDRIDNDGDYKPSNCRWATPDVQANNKPKGGRSDSWTSEDNATLTKMWREYYPVEAIASVLLRTPGTVRVRAHYLKLRRDSSFSRLAKKHGDLAPILRERGKDAFMVALRDKTSREKQAQEGANQQKKAAKSEVIKGIMGRQITRNEKMRALRLAGCNLSQIGSIFNISRERVRQLQLLNFKEPSDIDRKVSATRPENRNRHIDRLIAAWNRASVEARAIFLETANEDLRAKIPTLGTRSRLAPDRRAAA